MSQNSNEKYKHPANPERIAAYREIRRSNKAGSHDNRPKRLRTRLSVNRNSVRDFD